MGRNRNMDEFIKRELDGLEVQPTNLTFNKVQKAYHERKSGVRASRSKLQWPLVAILVIALFSFLYFYILPDTKTTSGTKPSALSHNPSEQAKQESVTSAENTGGGNSTPVSPVEGLSTSVEETPVAKVPDTEASPILSSKGRDHGFSKNNLQDVNTIKKMANGKKDGAVNTTPIVSEQKMVADLNNDRVHITARTQQVNADNGNGTSSNTQSLLTASGNTRNKRNVKKANAGNSQLSEHSTQAQSVSDIANAAIHKEEGEQGQLSEPGDQSGKTSSIETLNASAENKTSQEFSQSLYLFSVPVPFLSNVFKSAEPEVIKMPYNDSLARTDRFKDYYRKRLRPYYFTVSSEMQLNSIGQKITANNDVLVSVDLPQFKEKTYNEVLAEGISASTQLNLGGSFLLGFHYYDFGLETGIRFFGFENTTYLKHIPNSYHNKVFSGIVYDTLSNTYDTLYNVTSYHYPFKVNGDSISPSKYLSTYRFASIPLRLTYAFHTLRSKLIIEPSLGVQFCIPLASNTIVYDRPYEFVYEKSTNKLSPFIQYDGALKLQYQLSRSAGIYVREGYSAGQQSLYDAAYPVKLSVNNLYTSVGINITLRK